MQVIGVSVTDDAIAAIARRSTRPVAAEWAERVLKRHVRREKSLLVRIKDEKRLEAALKADGIPPEACARIRKAFQDKEPIYTSSKPAMSFFMTRAADTMDWIESLPQSDRRLRRIDRMAWTDAEKAAEAWHISLAKARKASKGIMEGARKLVDLQGGAFAAELTTVGALQAEGKAMGHCVGGYWSRVEKGETRIVSIRDADGQPHVTIELSCAPEVRFEDGGRMLASHRPVNGVDTVSEANNSWVAVQVRGKQNKVPVPRYMGFVSEWLAQSGIPWVEYGAKRTAVPGTAVKVYSVLGRHFRSPEKACDLGEPRFMQELAKKGGFPKLYRQSGLSAIHMEASKDRVEAFLEGTVPHLVDEFSGQLAKGAGFRIALRTSGLDFVLGGASGGGRPTEAARRRLFDVATEADAKAYSSREATLVEIPGARDLRMIVHSLPIMPLFALSMGFAKGMEDEVQRMVAPHFRKAAARMMADPDAVHVVKAAKAGMPGDDIRKGFVFCGLAGEYAVATSKVESAVSALLADARLAVKKARMSGKYPHEVTNALANLLAEGYEARIADRISRAEPGEALVVSAREKKARILRPMAEPEPLVKRYRMP